MLFRYNKWLIIFLENYVINQLKLKSKKKYLNTQYHKSLSMSIVSRYSVTNPDFLQIEDVSENYVDDYNMVSLSSLSKNITLDHYLTKPNSTLERKLLAMSDKNPKFVHSFDYNWYKHRYSHPSFQEVHDFYIDDFN